jgi:hypothetical protein
MNIKIFKLRVVQENEYASSSVEIKAGVKIIHKITTQNIT